MSIGVLTGPAGKPKMLAVSSDNALGEYLLKQLSGRGWSPADLARAADVRQSTVSRNLSGDRHPSPETLRRYATALEVSEDYLMVLGGYRTERRRDRSPELQAVVDALDEEWDSYSEERRDLLRQLVRRRQRLGG